MRKDVLRRQMERLCLSKNKQTTNKNKKESIVDFIDFVLRLTPKALPKEWTWECMAELCFKVNKLFSCFIAILLPRFWQCRLSIGHDLVSPRWKLLSNAHSPFLSRIAFHRSLRSSAVVSSTRVAIVHT